MKPSHVIILASLISPFGAPVLPVGQRQWFRVCQRNNSPGGTAASVSPVGHVCSHWSQTHLWKCPFLHLFICRSLFFYYYDFWPFEASDNGPVFALISLSFNTQTVLSLGVIFTCSPNLGCTGRSLINSPASALSRWDLLQPGAVLLLLLFGPGGGEPSQMAAS